MEYTVFFIEVEKDGEVVKELGVKPLFY